MTEVGFESKNPVLELSKNVCAWAWQLEIYEGHSVSHGNKFFDQKCSNAENGVYTFESTWHVFVNVTIRWGYMCSGAHAFCAQTWLCWRPRSAMEVRKMPSSYMIMLQPTQQTLLRTFPGVGGGKCYNALLQHIFICNLKEINTYNCSAGLVYNILFIYSWILCL
jgi:hypothetical protein